MNINEKSKTCSMCRISFPLTSEFFHRNSYSGDGFRSECKKCNKKLRDNSERTGKLKGLTARDPQLDLKKGVTMESFREDCRKIDKKRRKTIGYNEVTFDLGEEDVGIKLDCDWHIGNEMTNVDKWSEDIEITTEMDRCFTIMDGDYTDNLDAIKKQYESVISVPEAKSMVNDAVKLMKGQILGIIQGCFLEGTQIVADDYTMKPIENIEKVLGEKKSFNVKQHWNDNYTKGPIYKISYMGNSVFDVPATGNHPFIGIKRENILCTGRYDNKSFCKGINSGGVFCKAHCQGKPKIIPKTIKAENLNVGDFLYIPKP